MGIQITWCILRGFIGLGTYFTLHAWLLELVHVKVLLHEVPCCWTNPHLAVLGNYPLGKLLEACLLFNLLQPKFHVLGPGPCPALKPNMSFAVAVSIRFFGLVSAVPNELNSSIAWCHAKTYSMLFSFSRKGIREIENHHLMILFHHVPKYFKGFPKIFQGLSTLYVMAVVQLTALLGNLLCSTMKHHTSLKQRLFLTFSLLVWHLKSSPHIVLLLQLGNVGTGHLGSTTQPPHNGHPTQSNLKVFWGSRLKIILTHILTKVFLWNVTTCLP